MGDLHEKIKKHICDAAVVRYDNSEVRRFSFEKNSDLVFNSLNNGRKLSVIAHPVGANYKRMHLTFELAQGQCAKSYEELNQAEKKKLAALIADQIASCHQECNAKAAQGKITKSDLHGPRFWFNVCDAKGEMGFVAQAAQAPNDRPRPTYVTVDGEKTPWRPPLKSHRGRCFAWSSVGTLFGMGSVLCALTAYKVLKIGLVLAAAASTSVPPVAMAAFLGACALVCFYMAYRAGRSKKSNNNDRISHYRSAADFVEFGGEAPKRSR